MKDDPIELFQKITEENISHKNLQSHLIELIECLYKDLEQKTSVVESLQKQLQSLLKQETFGITSKYVCLKEKYDNLRIEITKLRNENDDLHTQLIAKDEEIKKLILEKEEQIQMQSMIEIKRMEDQLKQKNQELETIKLNHKKKEQELYNEIQAVEAASALQLDHSESNSRRQINELNKKLKEISDTCNILRNELFNIKEQFNDCKSRNAELQKQLRENCNYEQSRRQNQERSYNNSVVDESSTFESSSPTLFNNKYQPLEINQNNLLRDKYVYKKAPVYTTCGKYSEDNFASPPKSTHVPPLMQLNNTNSNKEKNTTRKRKLYNPNDVGFFNFEINFDK